LQYRGRRLPAYAATIPRQLGLYESSSWTSKEVYETSHRIRTSTAGDNSLALREDLPNCGIRTRRNLLQITLYADFYARRRVVEDGAMQLLAVAPARGAARPLSHRRAAELRGRRAPAA